MRTNCNHGRVAAGRTRVAQPPHLECYSVVVDFRLGHVVDAGILKDTVHVRLERLQLLVLILVQLFLKPRAVQRHAQWSKLSVGDSVICR